jgi:short-subunit dehydrogenase
VDTEFAQRAGIEAQFDMAPGFVKVSAADCARQAVQGLERGKRVVVPGLPIRMAGIGARYTPHAVLLPLLKRFYPV